MAIVNHLCGLLHAPRPWSIDVDLRPNASASFQGGIRALMRRRIVLTIGLPLIAGLSARELAGILAHELSHFGQGAECDSPTSLPRSTFGSHGGLRTRPMG